MLKFSRDKNEGTYRSGKGGEEPAICDPGSELRVGRRERCAKIMNGMRKIKNKKIKTIVHTKKCIFPVGLRYIFGPVINYIPPL